MTPAMLTAIFMPCSGILLYMLRTPNFRRFFNTEDCFWFFVPPKLRQDKDKEGKDGRSRRPFYMEFMAAARLLAVGVALQTARVVISKFHQPRLLVHELFTFNTHRLGIFLGGYDLLYRGSAWILRQLCKRDEIWHAFPAGVLAGSLLFLYPNATLCLTASSTVIQLILKRFADKHNFKYIHLWKFLLICIWTGFLTNGYFLNSKTCPPWFDATLNNISGGVSSELRKNFVKHRHILRLPMMLGGI